jgi:hypothetical protein
MEGNIKTPPCGYLTIGADLRPLVSVEQARMCHYLADQADHFANSLTDGNLNSVEITSGYLILTVYCGDGDQALSDLINMLDSGEFDIPKDGYENLVFRFAVTMVGEGDPVEFMIGMMDEVNGEDFICDDCIKAMKEEEAAQAAKKTWKQLADKSEPAGSL